MNQKKFLFVVHVNTSDSGGGAEKNVFSLFRSYNEKGHKSLLVVGKKQRQDERIVTLNNDSYRCIWARHLVKISNSLYPLERHRKSIKYLRLLLEYPLGQPRRWVKIERGYEDFDFPATWRLLDNYQRTPDIVHCHNLHGKYFDLRALPWLSSRVPVVLTLRDAWLLSGHCAHSFDCKGWETGCDRCAHLGIYPAIRRDAASCNWQRKKDIFARSRLYVASPSEWLLKKATRSILSPAIIDARVIPNGVDLSLFKGEKRYCRSKLGIPADSIILLFAATKIRQGEWRDFDSLYKALRLLSERKKKRNIVFIGLGDNGEPATMNDLQIRFVPFQRDETVVATYFQAADVYVHPSLADTFPNSVLEALASGMPVVATAVGGIPEQVRDGTTGYLVEPGDVPGMASRMERLIDDDDLRQRMGNEARSDCHRRFGLQRQVTDYLEWYNAIKAGWVSKRRDDMGFGSKGLG